MDSTLDFLRLLWRIEHSLQRRSKQMRVTIGITGPQRLVLRIVDANPGVAPGQLARIIRLHASTVTGIVQRLVDRGLLLRVADPGDRRRVQLRVRPQAKRYTRPSEGTIEAAVARVLSAVPATQVGHARTVLTAIAVALEKP